MSGVRLPVSMALWTLFERCMQYLFLGLFTRPCACDAQTTQSHQEHTACFLEEEKHATCLTQVPKCETDDGAAVDEVQRHVLNDCSEEARNYEQRSTDYEQSLKSEKTPQLAEKEQQVNEKERELSEKERELSEKVQELSEKEREVSEKGRELSEKERELSEKVQELSEKEREVSEKEQELSEKEREVSEKGRELSEKERELSEKERELSEKVQELSEKEQEVSETVQELSEKEQEVSEREREVSERERDVSKKEREGSEKEREVSEREREVSVREREVSERERDVSKKEREGSKKEREGSEKERQVSEREREVSVREREVSERERDVSKKEREGSEKEREVSEREREVSERKRKVSEREREVSEKEQQLAEKELQLSEKDDLISLLGRQLPDCDPNFDPWILVTNVHPELASILDPNEIGRCCVPGSLISFDDFTNMSTRNCSNAERVDQLIAMLRPTGPGGYEVFKTILKQFKSPHRYANILKKIEVAEANQLKHARPLQHKASTPTAGSACSIRIRTACTTAKGEDATISVENSTTSTLTGHSASSHEHTVTVISDKEDNGVHFKELPDVGRTRIFHTVASEFYGEQAEVLSLLVGWCSLQERKARHDRKNLSDRQLLFKELNMWSASAEQPTGRELYNALVDSGYPEEQVGKYKKVFQLPPTYTGGFSIFD